MKVELPKGTRDIDPSKKIVRDKIVSTIIKVFQRYGFLPLETPSFERIDVLTSKFTGGEEILKEIFKFNDQGKRELGLRYDLTVPLSRYISMHPNLKMPFKRYSIGRVYRDGPIKKGRLREFYQCDCDIVGSDSFVADATIIMIANEVFKNLKLPVSIKINNRKLLNGILIESGVDKELLISALLTIDKLEKQGKDYVKAELIDKKLTSLQVDKIFNYLEIKKIDNFDLRNEEGLEGIKQLKELFILLDNNKIEYEFDPSLARGLAYYTDLVVEGFLKKDLTSVAVCGGGRYNNMIKEMINSKQEFPAVGISFGLEVLSEVISDDEKTTTQIYIVPIGDSIKESLKVAKYLRDNKINVDIDMNNRGISKNLQYANSYKIPFVLMIGEEEIKNNKYQFKNMNSGEQKTISKETIVNYFS